MIFEGHFVYNSTATLINVGLCEFCIEICIKWFNLICHRLCHSLFTILSIFIKFILTSAHSLILGIVPRSRNNPDVIPPRRVTLCITSLSVQ